MFVMICNYGILCLFTFFERYLFSYNQQEIMTAVHFMAYNKFSLSAGDLYVFSVQTVIKLSNNSS